MKHQPGLTQSIATASGAAAFILLGGFVVLHHLGCAPWHYWFLLTVIFG